jgi:acyl dehydratase
VSAAPVGPDYRTNYEPGDVLDSKGRTVTEADIVTFAGLSGDFHSLHIDEVFARQGPFGGRIAHGFLVLALASGLMYFDDNLVQAFYGLDRVRFVSPVRPGDTIRVRTEVTGLAPHKEGRSVASLDVRITNQLDELVAVMSMKLLVNRPSEPAGPPA